MASRLTRLLLLLGGAALAFLMIEPHLPSVLASLRQIGWRFGPFFGTSLLLYVLDAWGWKLTLAAPATVPIGRLFGIRMAGEALNKITPLASMGGEPLKAYLLVRRGTPPVEAAASVAVSKFVMTVSQITFIFSGLLLAGAFLPIDRKLLIGLGIFPGTILSAMIVTGILDRFVVRRRVGTVPTVSPNRVQAALQAAGKLWAQIAGYVWSRPRDFAVSFVLFFLGWVAGGLELLAAALALGFPLSPVDAYVYETCIVSIGMAAFMIPAGAGAQEGGFATLAPAVGLTIPEGVALAVLRRCREAIWVVYGLLYLAITEGSVLIRTPQAPPGPDAAESSTA